MWDAQPTQGNVKGKVGNSNADPPLRPDGKLAVGDAVGKGEHGAESAGLKYCSPVMGSRPAGAADGLHAVTRLEISCPPMLFHKPLPDGALTRLPMSHPSPGVLSVVRSHPLQPQPYTGMVQIVSGEIAEDLATYMVGLALGWQFHGGNCG